MPDGVTSFSKYIDNINLKIILKHPNITQFRNDYSQDELDSILIRMGLRLKNGGLGIHAVDRYSDAAVLGMWANNIDKIKHSLGQLTVHELMLPMICGPNLFPQLHSHYHKRSISVSLMVECLSVKFSQN